MPSSILTSCSTATTPWSGSSPTPAAWRFDIEVPALERFATTTREVCDGRPACWTHACAACLEDTRCATSDRLPAHVFRGQVRPFPYPGRPEGLTLEVIHLKVGIVAGEISAYPTPVRQPLAAEAAARGGDDLRCTGDNLMDIRCPFPQDTLLQLGYTPERFATYRAFGRHLAARRLAPLLRADEAGGGEPVPP